LESTHYGQTHLDYTAAGVGYIIGGAGSPLGVGGDGNSINTAIKRGLRVKIRTHRAGTAVPAQPVWYA
jgi:hypothetical protein